jgi:septum formation protein
MDRIILASASSGRRQLFDKYFKEFTVSISDFDETAVNSGSPSELTRLLALGKAQEVSGKYPSDFVTGFDTLVVCEGRILGKPADKGEAKEILRFLSGRPQSVFSGYAVINRGRGISFSGAAETILDFKKIDGNFIEDYVSSHPVTRYAGAYAVQEKDELVSIISGSFDNVIGAPMEELLECLLKSGFPRDILRKPVI